MGEKQVSVRIVVEHSHSEGSHVLLSGFTFTVTLISLPSFD